MTLHKETMKPETYMWLDGEFREAGQNVLALSINSVPYATGIFEGERCYKTANGRRAIFRLRDHTNRLYDVSFPEVAPVHDMALPFTKDEFEEAQKELIRKNNVEAAYIRPLVFFRDDLPPFPDPKSVSMGITVYVRLKHFEKPIRMMIAKTIRRPSNATGRPAAKVSANYLVSNIAMREARAAGFDEGLLLDMEGNIAEGGAENLFLVKTKEQTIYTPPPGAILEGITRASVIQIARDAGLKVLDTKKITPADIEEDDEIFLTGTATEVVPVTQIDDVVLSGGKPGSVTLKLQEAYLDAVSGRNPRYEHWLAYVD